MHDSQNYEQNFFGLMDKLAEWRNLQRALFANTPDASHADSYRAASTLILYSVLNGVERKYASFIESAPEREYLDALVRLHQRSMGAKNLECLCNCPIEVLEVTPKHLLQIKNAGCVTVGDLVTRTENDFLRYKNFGRKSLREIAEALKLRGLSFGMNP